MPLFGNRMVVATANYKHIKEKKKEFFDRETRLGRWVAERKERKEKLNQLQERIKRVSSCEDVTDSREVALEEPIHPEINESTSNEPRPIPDAHFMVEEPEENHFGNRIVVGTADYRHVKEFKDQMNQREEAIAQWQVERAQRQEKLEILQTHIENLSRRNSETSLKSANPPVSAEEPQKDTKKVTPEVVTKAKNPSCTRCLLQ